MIQRKNTILFNFEAQTSNISYDIPDTSSGRERLNVRFETSNDLERQRGYGTHLSYSNVTMSNGNSDDYRSFNSETGEVKGKLYFNPNLRSGNHKYRLYVYDRGRGNTTYYTYIYWSELEDMGIISQDPIAFTNVSGTSDIDGPKVESITAQVKDYTDMSCSWDPDRGYATLENVKTVLSITDESLVTNDTSFPYDDQYYGDSYVNLGFSNFDANDDYIDTLSFNTDSTSISGSSKTFNLIRII